ncbi:unnamed protein product [Cuscuta europaea]|uniref:Endonuclease/exonuclease/phosphatase domain-containing protein n=1 Tax=Cuscuta europaea TaxID=41803 RepID=A0A9P0YWA1_CUSEU|nr:unnamed protein product [Cuscuta europaea]
MSIVSWNCRGLGNPATSQGLSDIINQHRLSIVFLMETKLRCQRAKEILQARGYVNSAGADCDGRGGGLALGWNDEVQVKVITANSNIIDCEVKFLAEDNAWWLTCYYAYPETCRRRATWEMLRNLSDNSLIPWMVMGDFNDILYESEKKGRIPHALWRMRGFREAILSCGLRDFLLMDISGLGSGEGAHHTGWRRNWTGLWSMIIGGVNLWKRELRLLRHRGVVATGIYADMDEDGTMFSQLKQEAPPINNP